MLKTPIKRGLQTLLSTNGVRCFSSSSNSLRSRSVYDDTFFNMASNLMRSIEREFDNARRLFGRNLISLPDPTSLFRIGELPATAQSSDLVQVDNEGNRKLHIEFDMSGFQPEEIKVRTQNHNLIISAKREKKVSHSFFLFGFVL
jgi:HSP20 family molecular chaperone IbpA